MKFALLTVLFMLPAVAAHHLQLQHWLANAAMKGLLLALTCLLFYCAGKSNI